MKRKRPLSLRIEKAAVQIKVLEKTMLMVYIRKVVKTSYREQPEDLPNCLKDTPC